jgi:RNA-directed DNA polymerase
MTNQIQHICHNLEDLNGLEELYQLLFERYAPSLGWKKPVSKKLLYYVQRNRDSLYTEFHIQKKSKALRTISAPKAPLKRVQKLTAELLSELVPKHPSAHGFLPGRSISGNAAAHVASPFVLNIDLENFFPSIPAGRIYGVLTKGTLKFSPKLAFFVTRICTLKDALPQGSPASPILSNLVCWFLDNRLRGLAEQYDVTYTRYADDLSFSSERPFAEAFLGKLDEIIKAENFKVNHKKVRLQKADVCQEVTGLVINEKVNLRREFIREIRAMLHNWEALGYEEAQQKFLENYFPKKAKGKSELKNVLAGKLHFFRMVRGAEDLEYLRYKNQFDTLSAGNYASPVKMTEVLEFPILHEPRKVVAFLRQFRTVNDSGFRELLHDPDTTDFDFLANMEKVNKAMPEVKEILTPSLYRKLKNFVDTYNKFGIPYFKETGCLPIRGKRRKVAREATSAEVMKQLGIEEERERNSRMMIPPDPNEVNAIPKHIFEQMIPKMFVQKKENPKPSEKYDDAEVPDEIVEQMFAEMDRQERLQNDDFDIPDDVLEKMENTGDDFFDIPSQEEINSILEKAFGAETEFPDSSDDSAEKKKSVLGLRTMRPGIFPSQPVTRQAFIFRSQIRVGTDYFHDLILVNALKPVILQLNSNGNVHVAYEQKEDEFAVNCTFFTDSWQVRNAIVILLRDLALNPAYAPEGSNRRIFLRSATVQPNPKKKTFCTNIYLRLEEGKVDMAELKRNSAVQKAAGRLKNLGDWSVLLGHEGKTDQHFLLESPDAFPHQLPYQEGLTHKLTFFQS